MKLLKYFIFAFILLIGIRANAVTFDAYYPPEDDYPTQSIVLSPGTLIRVMNLRDINTFTGDIGDECEFISDADFFVGEYIIIPKNSHFFGKIEDIREPVQGNNASMKIKIEKIVTPNQEKTYYMEGYIEGGSDFYIGGEQTAPAYYKTTPHYTQGWGGGILQMTPLNIYGFGKHTQIKPGQEVHIILVKDLKIY